MMLKIDRHKYALDKLDKLIDLEHIRSCEELQENLWTGKPLDRIPCFISFPTPSDWPEYPFTECWDDLEKNFMTGLSVTYCGALLKDDRLCTLTPDYGVISIPELFGIKVTVSDLGRSMSVGLRDVDKIKALIDRGIPDLHQRNGAKVEAFEDFAFEALGQYGNLSRAVHVTIADTQGTLDLASHLWGHEILCAFYDYPDVVRQLMELVTQTYIEYSLFHKRKLGEPLNSGYHVCGIKLVRGGVRICDDSAILCSKKTYEEFISPYNARAFAPFDGGWVHYCGNGNHILDDILKTPGIHALHMGNPDHCDLYELYQKTRAACIVLIWSGSLDRIKEVCALERQDSPPKYLMVLTENRYASANLEGAKRNLERIRSYQPIEKSPY
jgi:hypothetical protein